MDLALWIAAGLLAAVALVGGVSKTFVPQEKLVKATGGRWTADAGVGFVKTLGVLELLAAVGLVLPAVLDIAPVMVAVTAVCWVVLMIGAIAVHVRYRDGAKYVVATSAYLVLAAFVAWGRFGPGSFTA